MARAGAELSDWGRLGTGLCDSMSSASTADWSNTLKDGEKVGGVGEQADSNRGQVPEGVEVSGVSECKNSLTLMGCEARAGDNESTWPGATSCCDMSHSRPVSARGSDISLAPGLAIVG